MGIVTENRHLFLKTGFFDAYSDDERTAAVLQEISLADSYYPFSGTLLATHVVLAYYGSIRIAMALTGSSTPFPNWPGLPWLLLVGLLVLGGWHVRRKVYRGDQFAAEQTDEQIVVDVLDTLNDVKRENGRDRWEMTVLSLLWTRPSPEKRIDHLQE
jgi:hypothetical protein